MECFPTIKTFSLCECMPTDSINKLLNAGFSQQPSTGEGNIERF